MTKNAIARVWSRVPIFLKILLYGSGGFALLVGYLVMRVNAGQRPCDEARAAEARAWSALAQHFDRWEDSHPAPAIAPLPDGGIDIDAVVRRGFREGRADSCRSAAEQLQTGSFALYANPGPDDDDAVGLHMWQDLQRLRSRTESVCF